VKALACPKLRGMSVSTAIRLGARLRKLRLRHGWSQEKLAEKAGTYGPVVSRIEDGIHDIRLDTLNMLLKPMVYCLRDVLVVLDSDPKWIIDRKGGHRDD